MPPVVWAADGAAGPVARPGGAAGPLTTFFPLIAFGLIFYFLLFRPQQKTQKERVKMLSSVKRSDKVLTAGGIYGTVVNVKGDILDVKLAENVKVEIHRSYIAKVLPSLTNGSAASAGSGAS
ncbi:MAG: preprotein translocase subunit YajC [Elusimicrobia bacterium]|nr:preprotein translocase subunit YajC [Elusimicrobiota bacterium]